MVRPLRIEYPGAWYHVTSRGNERRAIFKDDQDRIGFLGILALTIAAYGVELHAYMLVDNHFYLLVTTLDANLKSFMHRLNTTYRVYYNQDLGLALDM